MNEPDVSKYFAAESVAPESAINLQMPEPNSFLRPVSGLLVKVIDRAGRISPTNMAVAHRVCKLAGDVRDTSLARNMARRHFAALITSPNALTNQLNVAAKRVRPRPKIDQEQASEVLRDLQQCADAHDLKPFLMFGTLLGAVREQGIIRGDNDVDLGIIDGTDMVRFRRAVRGSIFKSSRIRWHSGTPAKFTLKHPNGCRIDVNAFKCEPDGSLGWVSRSYGIVLKKQFPHQIGLMQINFIGVTVYIPDCAEEFLEWQYGPDWRTPDRAYHMITSGPIHGSEHREYTRTAGPRAILRNLFRGRVAEGLAMAQGMARLFPQDELWPQLAIAIEAAWIEAKGNHQTVANLAD